MRIHRNDGAAAGAEELLGELLRARPDRQLQVVAVHCRVSETIEDVPECVAEVRVGTRQVVVHRAFEPALRPRLGRVANRLGGEAVLRIPAVVDRLAAGDGLLRIRSECHLLSRGLDEPARNAELHDALNCVVLLVLQARHGPGLPVRRCDDECDEEHDRHNCKPIQLTIHRTPPRSALARLETSINPASTRKFARMLEPPYETSGSVIPVRGITRRMPPTMMNVWNAKPNVRPAASSFEKPSPAKIATRKPRSVNTMYTRRIRAAPISPSS